LLSTKRDIQIESKAKLDAQLQQNQQ